MPNIKTSREVYSQMNNLVEEWNDRISIVEQVNEGSLDYDKKIVLAQCLENTQQAINMMEATDAGSTDGFKRFALDLVTAI